MNNHLCTKTWKHCITASLKTLYLCKSVSLYLSKHCISKSKSNPKENHTPKLDCHKPEYKYRTNKLQVFRSALYNNSAWCKMLTVLPDQPSLPQLISKSNNFPNFLYRTIADLTAEAGSPSYAVPSIFSSNRFIDFFKNKISTIRLQTQSTQATLITTDWVPQLWWTRIYIFLSELTFIN